MTLASTPGEVIRERERERGRRTEPQLFHAEYRNTVPPLGSGFLLLGESLVARKIAGSFQLPSFRVTIASRRRKKDPLDMRYLIYRFDPARWRSE